VIIDTDRTLMTRQLATASHIVLAVQVKLGSAYPQQARVNRAVRGVRQWLEEAMAALAAAAHESAGRGDDERRSE
jgi:hypothetical protein